MNIVEEIRSLNNAIIKELFLICKKNNIDRPSPLQFSIIKILFEKPDHAIFQKDLEMELNVSKATISEALKALEKNDIIKRIADEGDSRVKIIFLTGKSQKKILEMENNVKLLNEKMLLNIDEKELDQFLRTLIKLKNNINER